jgi:Family of unknown function (DUF5906)
MTTPSQSPEASKAPTAAYVRDLEKRGFCAIDDMSANQTRLLNRFDGRKLPMSFLRGDFHTYKRGKDIQGELPSVEFVAACLPHVVGTKFLPGAGPLYTDPTTRMTFANTYRAYQATHDHARISPLFTEFFERMLCDDERHIVLQYLSHIIQRPYERPSWHIMIPSDTGTGKGFLLQEILHPLLLHTSVISSFGKLTGQFSSVLEDNLLVLLDDCKARSDATQTQLKSILSEERQYVERKTLQGGMVTTYTRMILASNERKPLHLDKSERRWFVTSRVEHRESRGETQDFIAKVAAWLKEPGSLCAVYNFFWNYDLTGFNPKAVPASRGLQDIIALSRDPYADFVAEYTADHRVFTYGELASAFTDASMSKPNDRYLGHLIVEAGFHRKRTMIAGTQVSIYFPQDMPLEQARTLYPAPNF